MKKITTSLCENGDFLPMSVGVQERDESKFLPKAGIKTLLFQFSEAQAQTLRGSETMPGIFTLVWVHTSVEFPREDFLLTDDFTNGLSGKPIFLDFGNTLERAEDHDHFFFHAVSAHDIRNIFPHTSVFDGEFSQIHLKDERISAL